MTTTKTRLNEKEPKRRRSVMMLQRRALRVPRTGLHEQAARKLRTLIVRGDLLPGEPLLEVNLSEALGISRTPLREALKQLAAEGLVELQLNRSAVVAPLLREELTELFEAVSGIERCAAELAATRMTAADVERLEALQRRIERHHDRGELRDYFEVNQQNSHHHRRLCPQRRAEGLPRRAAGTGRACALVCVVGRRAMGGVGARAQADPRCVEGARRRAGGCLLGHHVRRTGEIVADTLAQKKATP